MKNPGFNNPNDDYYTQDKEFIFHLIPEGPNVILDVGCGSGRVGKKLLESNKAADVIGIEIFEDAAREALNSYKVVHVGDIENMELVYDRYFDIVICGDVLEHLREPSKVLEQLHRFLKDDGLIICCVPNIRYWRIWMKLVFRGDWDYADEGIMDRTHLRFFTTRSFKKLLKSTLFTIQDEEMRIAVGPKQNLFNRITGGKFKEFLAIQMILTARKDCLVANKY